MSPSPSPGRGQHLRLLAAQRLVCPRHPVLGKPAARAVSRQELCHQRFALGGANSRARPVPRPRQSCGRLEIPSPLPYLFDAVDQYTGAIDMTVEALLLTPAMRSAGQPPHRLSQAKLRELWWTPAQLIAHHTSNGCNLLSGDLLATGHCLQPGRRIRRAACWS